MTFAEMKTEVENIVNDETFNDSIPGYINEAFLQASGRINIPDLKRIGVGVTIVGQNFLSLAGIANGFSGRLSKLTKDTILRFNSVEDLLTWVSENSREFTEAGPVEAVALEGRTLWYFPIPATPESIQCVLYTNPISMINDEDTPDAFPEICHRNIGIHGAASLACAIIEDGIEGDKVNTLFNMQMNEKGILQLTEWIGKHRVHYISSILNDGITVTSTT